LIGYNQNGCFDILSGSFVDYVNKCKTHPAILFWELGNKYNYNPVATAHGELPDSLALALCPNIDIWGMNVYRSDNPETIFTEWEKISNKPMYLSEAGAYSYMTIARNGYEKGPNEKAQADATKNILDATFQHASVC